ncbi:MAG: phage minor head protein [Acidobacteriota bacterium]
MKTLPPQHLREAYWDDMESQLKAIFYEIVFAPIVEILRKASPQGREFQEMMNAQGGGVGSLMMALRTGRVQYTDGVFSGDFSVAISKDLRSLGASFDHRALVYRLDVGRVPEQVRAEAANYQTVAKAAHDAVLRQLNEVQKDLERLVKSKPVDAEATIGSINKGFKKSAELLEVRPELDKKHVEQLAKDYSANMELYITDFSKQSIVTLREAVEDNAMQGFRFDRLTEMVRHRYGVTANKAKFLARQETGLFMAKFRKQRLQQSGVKRYRWSTAHDERVRDSHRRLNGQTFTYDQPPITNRTTGERNNPGEDFGCRCVDIPILEKDAAYV